MYLEHADGTGTVISQQASKFVLAGGDKIYVTDFAIIEIPEKKEAESPKDSN